MLIDKLYYSLGMDNSDFKRKVNETGSLLGSMDSKMTGLMRGGAIAAAGIAVIGAAFVMTARKAVDFASVAEETRNKFNVVYGDMSSQARKWAEDFSDSVGRSESDIESWMSRLQDTFVPLGFTRQKSMELSQSLTKLAVDVASFNNAADDEVLNLFTSALVGNHEAVRRFGIIISEASLKQEALRSGLKKQYSDLTDLEKVQLRYNILLNSSKDAQGDAIRTADGYANQVKRMNAEMKTLWENLGKLFIPVFTNVVSKISAGTKAIGDFFDAIKPDKLDDYITKLKELGAEAKVVAMLESQRAILAVVDERTKAQEKIAKMMLNEERANRIIEESQANQLAAAEDIAREILYGNEIAAEKAKKQLAAYEDMQKEAKQYLEYNTIIKESTKKIVDLEKMIADIREGRLDVTKKETANIIDQTTDLSKQLELLKKMSLVPIPLSGGIRGVGVSHKAPIPEGMELEQVTPVYGTPPLSFLDNLWTSMMRGENATAEWIKTGTILADTLFDGKEEMAKFTYHLSDLIMAMTEKGGINWASATGAIIGIFSTITDGSERAKEAAERFKEELDALKESLNDASLAMIQSKWNEVFAEYIDALNIAYKRQQGFLVPGIKEQYEQRLKVIKDAMDNFGKFTDDFSGVINQWNYQIGLLDIDDPTEKLKLFREAIKKTFGIELPEQTENANLAIENFLKMIAGGKNVAEAFAAAFGMALPTNLTGAQTKELIAQWESLLDELASGTVGGIPTKTETMAFTYAKEITYRQANELVTASWASFDRLTQIRDILNEGMPRQQTGTAQNAALSLMQFATLVTVNAQNANVNIGKASVVIGSDGFSAGDAVARLGYQSSQKSMRAQGA